MKKIVAQSFTVLLCLLTLLCPASATDTSNTPEYTLVSSHQIELLDGGYFIETIEVAESSITTRATTSTSGKKTRVRYTASGSAVYSVEVTGKFNYTGSTSSATYAAATVYTYDTNASYVSKYASYSGNTAYATGTVKYLTTTESQTVSLSCDKNGNLS
jgi:hypothetical protein